jgi:hypothetical protein
MADGDDFINISLLFPRTTPVASDIVHIRSTGGIDSKMRYDDFLRDIANESLLTDLVQTDDITEKTASAGVTIEGSLLKDGVVQTDNITEKTASAGVTIEGSLLKDSRITTGISIVKGNLAYSVAFGVLSPLIPSIGDKITLAGTLGSGTNYKLLYYAERTSSTQITLYLYTPDTPATITFILTDIPTTEWFGFVTGLKF